MPYGATIKEQTSGNLGVKDSPKAVEDFVPRTVRVDGSCSDAGDNSEQEGVLVVFGGDDEFGAAGRGVGGERGANLFFEDADEGELGGTGL